MVDELKRIKDLPRLTSKDELLPWAHRLVNDLFLQLVHLADIINVISSTPPPGQEHDLLSAEHPDTLPGSPVRGDLVVSNGTPLWTKLAVGTIGKFLRSDGTDPGWATIARSDLPSEIAYEDEVNLFALGQRFQTTIEMLSTPTPANPPSGSVYLYQETVGATTEVRIRFDDGTECIVCTHTIGVSGELPLQWVE